MNIISKPGPLAGHAGSAFVKTLAQLQVDDIEAAVKKMPQVDLPLTHRFTPGLYIREISMPKGALVVSKIHKTEHPFVVSKGHAAVWVEGVGVVQIKAPYTGITKPGTRRILYIHEDCVWTTFHPTNKTDPKEIEADVIMDPANAEPFELDGQIAFKLTQ